MGSETSLSQRPVVDPVSGSPSSTTLSGELNDPATASDNSSNVFNDPKTLGHSSDINNTAVLDGVTITGGYAEGNGSISARNPASCGSGMYNTGSPIVRNCLFTKNYSLNGGAIFTSNFYTSPANPQILNCVFDNNQAAYYGGAIYNYQIFVGLSITNCVFRNNSAKNGGGAVYNGAITPEFEPSATYPKLTNCLFEQNRAPLGGAIYNDAGGFYGHAFTCSPFLTKCNFINNTADYGGAMYNYVLEQDGHYAAELSPVLVNCLFQGNSAVFGGAIQTDIYSDPTDQDNDQTYNPIFINVCFQSNTASNRGGAIGMEFGGGSRIHSQSRLTNCTFHDNKAPRGAAIYAVSQGYALSPGAAETSNAGDNAYDISHTLINCVLFGNGNSNHIATQAIFTQATQVPLITSSLLETSITGYVADPSNRTTATTPFESPNSGELTAPSDAINGGNNAAYAPPYALMVDLVGKPRFYNTTVDMGAYEYRDRPCAPTVVYVTPTGAGDLTGSSWANATRGLFLPRRLANSCPGATFYLATGLYTPTSGADRSVSFIIPDGVQLYGGYAGTGPNPDARLGFPASTTLSGDIGQPGDNRDNSYHVVKILNGGAQTLLNGLIITGGLANGGGDDDAGAGLYIRGTGIKTVSSPQLVNVAIQSNQATRGGGLFSRISYAGSSSPSLVNVSFQANSAPAGGGLYVKSDGEGCKACDYSYGLDYGAVDMALTNVSISQNSATQGGGVFFTYQDYYRGPQAMRITNSILFDNGSNPINKAQNATITSQYSLLETGTTNYQDGGNTILISQSPFVSPTSQQLKVGSPAINSASNASYSAVSSAPFDLALIPRILGGTIDRGAFELPSDLTPLLYARPTTVNGTQAISVVVDVVELNSVTTDGAFSVKISKDAKVNLSFDPSATSVGNKRVNNQAWSFSGPSGGFYTLTATQPVVGGGVLSVGLNGTLTPGATTGTLSLNAIVAAAPLLESQLTNNSDADKIDYFQQ